MFYLCSNALMTMPLPRIDEDTLYLYLEVALSTAPLSVLDGLADPDRHRRRAAIGEVVRQLVDRLRCFDIRSEERTRRNEVQPCLFPHDMGPIG